MKSIVFGGGCFWCVEACLRRVKGVLQSEVGYAGASANATYESVCGGDGNVEVCKLLYDEKQISLEELCRLFFLIHDPTSFNKQGADEGLQYASVIFYEDENDKPKIATLIQEAEKNYQKPIVTRLEKLQFYTRAEDYHQDYFSKNANKPYCQAIIIPKLQHFLQEL